MAQPTTFSNKGATPYGSMKLSSTGLLPTKAPVKTGGYSQLSANPMSPQPNAGTLNSLPVRVPTQSDINTSGLSTGSRQPIDTSGTSTSNYTVGGQQMNVGAQGTSPGFINPVSASANTSVPTNSNTGNTGGSGNTTNKTPPANPTVDANAAHDALIKATQDKLNTAKTSLKTMQEGIANGTLNTDGTPKTPTTPETQAGYSADNPPTVGSLASELANMKNNPPPQVVAAQKAIQDLKNEYAQKGVNINQTAGFLTQANGEQGLLQNQYLTGLNAAETAYNQATNQWQNQIGATESAMNAVAPQAYGYTSQPYLPGSNTFAQGGQSATERAVQAGNIQGANATAQAQTQQKQAYTSAHQQAQNLVSQASDLMKSFGLNPSEVNAANMGIQAIARNTSDPHYQGLMNYFTDIASRYSQILTPAGGSSTDTVRATAQGMIDSTASGSSIQQVFNMLDQQAQAVIAGVTTNQNGNTNTNSNQPAGWF